MSRLSNRDQRHDPYYRKAKAEGYASRAIYKLKEIDERYRIFVSGQRVLDLGFWPGSWLQYAAEKVGPKGLVLGIDLKPPEISLPAHVRCMVADARTVDPLSLLLDPASFDVVLSDMAPKTTGIRLTDVARSLELFQAALDLACQVLRPGGTLVAKLFQGPGIDEAFSATKKVFKKAKLVRPKSSRQKSMESYVIAFDRRVVSL